MRLYGSWLNFTKRFWERRKGNEPSRSEIATPEMVVLTPIPCWQDLSPEEYQQPILELVEQIENETVEMHEAAATQPLGSQAIFAQDPHAKPALCKLFGWNLKRLGAGSSSRLLTMIHLRPLRSFLVVAGMVSVSCAGRPVQAPAPAISTAAPQLARIEGVVAATDQVTIHYAVLGDSGPLIIVPLGRLSGDFEPLAREGFRVVMMDPRGRGLSTAVSEGIPLSTEADIADIDDVRRHFGEDRITLIGSSYYGALAALYAAEYPQHVARIVMLGPMAPTAKIFAGRTAGEDPDTPEYRKLDQLRREGVHISDPAHFCRVYYTAHAYQLYADPSRFDPNGLDFCDLENEWPDNSHGWANALFESIGAWDFTEEAGKITAPALVIQGRKDRVTPPFGAEAWIAAMRGQARLVWIDESGHLPYKEWPERTLGIILDFLGSDKGP